jgi:YD repeat-containing protein
MTLVQSPMLQGTTYGYQYQYDDMDDVTQVTDPNGNIQTYQYDFVGNVILATDARGFSTSIDITGTLDKTTTCDALNNCSVEQRDTNGRRSNFTDKRGIKTVYQYDKLSRVIEVDFNNNHLAYDQRTITFGYDMADRVTGITDVTNNGTPTQIAYQYGNLDKNIEEDTAEGPLSTNTT